MSVWMPHFGLRTRIYLTSMGTDFNIKFVINSPFPLRWIQDRMHIFVQLGGGSEFEQIVARSKLAITNNPADNGKRTEKCKRINRMFRAVFLVFSLVLCYSVPLLLLFDRFHLTEYAKLSLSFSVCMCCCRKISLITIKWSETNSIIKVTHTQTTIRIILGYFFLSLLFLFLPFRFEKKTLTTKKLMLLLHTII